jgi:hypothetical protein
MFPRWHQRQADYGGKVLEPGTKVVTGAWDAVSLGLALMFGTAGLPHILMRFYMPDATQARKLVVWATIWIGGFYLITFILGFGAMVLVGQKGILAAGGGGNMAGPLLAKALGPALFGFMRGRLCDNPRGGGGTYAVGRRGSVARLLGQHRQGRSCLGRKAAQGRSYCVGHSRHLRDPAGHRLPGPERPLYGRPHLLDRGFGQLPGADAGDLLEAADHGRRRLQHHLWGDRDPGAHLSRAHDPTGPS